MHSTMYVVELTGPNFSQTTQDFRERSYRPVLVHGHFHRVGCYLLRSEVFKTQHCPPKPGKEPIKVLSVLSASICAHSGSMAGNGRWDHHIMEHTQAHDYDTA